MVAALHDRLLGNQSLEITWEWGRQKILGGITCSPGEQRKGGLWKADYPWRGWGSLEHYRALWGDQVKFIVTQTNPPKRFPSQTINDPSLTSANEEYRFSCRHRFKLRLNLDPFLLLFRRLYVCSTVLPVGSRHWQVLCLHVHKWIVSIDTAGFFVISLELLIVTFQLGFHIAYNNWPIWDSQNAIELEYRNRSAILFLTVQTAENFTYPTNLS